LNMVREMEKTGLLDVEQEIDPVTYEAATPDLHIMRVALGRGIRTLSYIENFWKPTEKSMVLHVVTALSVGKATK